MEENIDQLVREQDRLREMVGSLELNIERRTRQRIEAAFAQRLQAELQTRDAEVAVLKNRIKSLEGEEAKKASGEGERQSFGASQRGSTGLRLSAKDQARETVGKLTQGFRNFQFTQYVRTIAFAQLLLCFMTNVARIDLFCVIILLALYACNELDRKAMASYLGFMTFSVIIDIVWMVQHADSSIFAVTQSFGNAIQFVFAITVLAMVAKLVILYPAFSTYRTLPPIKPSEQASATPVSRSIYAKILDAISIIQLAFCFCNALARADLYALVILFLLYAVHEKDRAAMKGYFLFLIFSVLVDVCWLGITARSMYLMGQQGLARRAYPVEFVFFTSIVNLAVKIIFVFLNIPTFRALPNTKPSESKQFIAGVLSDGLSKATLQKVFVTAKSMSYAKWTTGIIATQLVLCFFQSLARLDAFAIVCAIGLYAVNESDKLALEAYFAFLGISFFFDIAWLDLHKDPSQFAWLAGDAATVAFVSAACILGILLKFAILFPAIRHHAELPDIKPSEQGTAIGNQRAKVLAFYAKFKQLAEAEKYRRVMLAFGLIHMVLFFFMALDRVDPFCIIIPILLYAIHERDRNALLAYLLFMDFSFLIDIIWLSMHTDDIKALASGSSTINPSLVFVYACAIVSVIVKFAAHIPAVLLLRTLPNKTTDDSALTAAALADRGMLPSDSLAYSTAARGGSRGGSPPPPGPETALSMGDLERVLREREERLSGYQ